MSAHPAQCKRRPDCLGADGHDGECGSWRDLCVETTACAKELARSLFPADAISRARAWAREMRKRRQA